MGNKMRLLSLKNFSQVQDLEQEATQMTAEDKGILMGIITLGLTSWASLSIIFMMIRSWSAENWDWVAILSGLLCISASLSIVAWKSVALDYGDRGEKDGTR